jgi:hypothetical protein
MRLDFTPDARKMFHICWATSSAAEDPKLVPSYRVSFFIVTTVCFWKLWLAEEVGGRTEEWRERRLRDPTETGRDSEFVGSLGPCSSSYLIIAGSRGANSIEGRTSSAV